MILSPLVVRSRSIEDTRSGIPRRFVLPLDMSAEEGLAFSRLAMRSRAVSALRVCFHTRPVVLSYRLQSLDDTSERFNEQLQSPDHRTCATHHESRVASLNGAKKLRLPDQLVRLLNLHFGGVDPYALSVVI